MLKEFVSQFKTRIMRIFRGEVKFPAGATVKILVDYTDENGNPQTAELLNRTVENNFLLRVVNFAIVEETEA